MTAQAQMQLIDLGIASEEIRARRLGEALQPKPGVLQIDDGARHSLSPVVPGRRGLRAIADWSLALRRPA